MYKLQKVLKDKYPLICAPLAGLSDLPFRMLNRKFGCKYAFVEMIHARSLTYENQKTMDMLRTNKADCPLGLQLLGDEADYLKSAIDILEKIRYPHDVLDFNAACPQKKITSKGEGAAILKDRKKLTRLVKQLVKYSKVPVTVKMRVGWEDNKKAADLACSIENAGASVLFVHGRTKAQGYRGEVDYKSIAKIKKKIKIPVVASGNILDPQMAKKMFDQTGCDGVLIARGGLGNPWIYKKIDQYLTGKNQCSQPSIDDIADTMKLHMNMFIEHYGKQFGLWRFRKFFVWYTRGMSNIKQLRCRVMHISEKKDMLDVIEDFKILASSK